jgi:hypothetical protein
MLPAPSLVSSAKIWFKLLGSGVTGALLRLETSALKRSEATFCQRLGHTQSCL